MTGPGTTTGAERHVRPLETHIVTRVEAEPYAGPPGARLDAWAEVEDGQLLRWHVAGISRDWRAARFRRLAAWANEVAEALENAP